MRKFLEETKLDQDMKKISEFKQQDDQMFSLLDLAKSLLGDNGVINMYYEQLNISKEKVREVFNSKVESIEKLTAYHEDLNVEMFKDLKNEDGELIYKEENMKILDSLLKYLQDELSIALMVSKEREHDLEKAIELVEKEKKEKIDAMKEKQERVANYVQSLIDKFDSSKKAYEEIVNSDEHEIEKELIASIRDKMLINLEIGKEVESCEYLKERLSVKPFSIYLKEAKEETNKDLPIMAKICKIGGVPPYRINYILNKMKDLVDKIAFEKGFKFKYKIQDSIIALALILAQTKRVINTSENTIKEQVYLRYLVSSIERMCMTEEERRKWLAELIKWQYPEIGDGLENKVEEYFQAERLSDLVDIDTFTNNMSEIVSGVLDQLESKK